MNQSLLAIACDKLKNLQSQHSTPDHYLEFLSGELIFIFQKLILEGGQYKDDASADLTSLESEINGLNEILSEYRPQNEDFDTSKDVKQINIDLSESPTEKYNANKAAEDIRKCIQAIQILQKAYIPNLRALITSIQQSQQNLSLIEDGLIIDTHKFEGYDLFLELATLINDQSGNDNKIYNYYLYLINLLLAYIDDYLECNDNIISTLDGVISFLANENKDSEIIDVLREKAEFLRFKIQFRFSRPNTDYNVSRTSPKELNGGVFFGLGQKIKDHYTNNFGYPGLVQKILTYQSSDHDKLELEPFHHLNRYYSKFPTSNLDEALTGLYVLENKLGEFSKDSFQSLYDQNAFSSVTKLIKNTILKLSFKKVEESRYSQIISDFQKILLQDEIEDVVSDLSETKKKLDIMRAQQNFPDYYCYILFIKFLNGMIDEFIRHPDKIINTIFFKNIIERKKALKHQNPEIEVSEEEVITNSVDYLRSKFEVLTDHIKSIYSQILRNLQDDLRLMVTHKVKPISLRFQESRVEVKWRSNTESTKSYLFLDSSYILPINHNHIYNKVESWTALLGPQINNLLYALEMSLNRIIVDKNVELFEKKASDNTQNFTNLVIEKTEALSNESKKNEFRTVSILAMFISVATFVLTNVKTFENKSPMESIGILFGIAGCLILFNLFFYVSIVRENDSMGIWTFFKKIWIAVLLPVLFGAASYFILNNEKKSNIHTFKNIQDSLANSYKILEEMKQEQKKINKVNYIQPILDSAK